MWLRQSEPERKVGLRVQGMGDPGGAFGVLQGEGSEGLGTAHGNGRTWVCLQKPHFKKRK